MRRGGFTLIELLVSIAVIGILLTVGFKGYQYVITKAKATQLIDQLEQIKEGMAQYYKHTGTYPANLRYLLTNPRNEGDNAAGYDAISAAAAGSEDETIIGYWGGPYIHNMKESPDVPGCLVAKGGGVICFGASITDNSTYSKPTGKKICSPVDGDDDCSTLSYSAGSIMANEGGGQYYNVLQVNFINKAVAKVVFESANGRGPDSNGNLQDVAMGMKAGESNIAQAVTEYIGVPSSTNYSKFDRIIYRYSDLF